MRISDWSSDVCSSDLDLALADVEVDVLQRLETGGVGLVQVADGDDRLHVAPSARRACRGPLGMAASLPALGVAINPRGGEATSRRRDSRGAGQGVMAA